MRQRRATASPDALNNRKKMEAVGRMDGRVWRHDYNNMRTVLHEHMPA
jgi:hypothetical protein